MQYQRLLHITPPPCTRKSGGKKPYGYLCVFHTSMAYDNNMYHAGFNIRHCSCISFLFLFFFFVVDNSITLLLNIKMHSLVGRRCIKVKEKMTSAVGGCNRFPQYNMFYYLPSCANFALITPPGHISFCSSGVLPSSAQDTTTAVAANSPEL